MVSNNYKKVALFPTPADPTIVEVLGKFLAEQRARLKDRTFANYRDIVDLLRSYLNGYAYSYLSESEGDLFDRYFNADDETHREFCQLFGPEKIPENLGGFLGDFMVRKVIAGSDFKRAGGTVTRKLSRWLVERAYIGAEDGLLGAQEGADAARNLPPRGKGSRTFLLR